MTVLIESLQSLFDRDLKRLAKEITAYPDENKMWLLEKEINNTAGNLCLHLCGNLQYYVGNVLGKSGYIRDRENEFSAKNIAAIKLIEEIETTRKIVSKTLSGLAGNDMEKIYPEQVLGFEMTTTFFLVHLQGHLNYHLGQINYHRRLVG
jgi:uncharacterized damage-inducible protein DinB